MAADTVEEAPMEEDRTEGARTEEALTAVDTPVEAADMPRPLQCTLLPPLPTRPRSRPAEDTPPPAGPEDTEEPSRSELLREDTPEPDSPSEDPREATEEPSRSEDSREATPHPRADSEELPSEATPTPANRCPSSSIIDVDLLRDPL